MCIEDLETPISSAAFNRRDDIIQAQVGREIGSKGNTLRAEAEAHLEIILDCGFWQHLSMVIEDTEPIAYATNICQSDHAHPDVVLLAFVGMFLYFRNLPSERSNLSKEMTKHLECCWKGFDQELMVTALILNPYEQLERFGPKAEVDILQLDQLVVSQEAEDEILDDGALEGSRDEHER
ncbi:hypothetical protein D9758_011232 [Tetrapyrgos nigripes]|uniref:Uncharacterized protein n=1 Tax=Tetrapyrgos nigripes TaxID=182062 RepID=A0A8H5D7H3_9AGAR|nr:hypothetical protein D9758_011232 [Tetrapyrgos nigripes]